MTEAERLAALEARFASHDEADRAEFKQINATLREVGERVRRIEVRLAAIAAGAAAAGASLPQLVQFITH